MTPSNFFLLCRIQRYSFESDIKYEILTHEAGKDKDFLVSLWQRLNVSPLSLPCRRSSATTAVAWWPTCPCLPTPTLILWRSSWPSCVSKSSSPVTWSYEKERWVGKCTSSSTARSLLSHAAVRRSRSTMERISGVNHYTDFKLYLIISSINWEFIKCKYSHSYNIHSLHSWNKLFLH